MYYWPYETIWKHSQSCWHHMYLGISSLYCLINENIGHPKLMYLITINRYEVHPWIWFWITPDTLVYPYHANRGFQCNILGFFIYFKYIPNIQGNINLEEIVTLGMQPKIILGNIKVLNYLKRLSYCYHCLVSFSNGWKVVRIVVFCKCNVTQAPPNGFRPQKNTKQ